jgi:hypothetical protein
MTDIKLTKESEYILTAMYKEFLNRYNNGIPRDKAKVFGHQENILALVPEIPEQDITGLLAELKDQEMIVTSSGSDISYFVNLTTKAIVFMENRVGTKVSEVIKALANIKSLFA